MYESTVYKQNFTKKGRTLTTHVNYIRFTGLVGKTVRTPGFRTYEASKAYARKIEILLQCKREGRSPDESLLAEIARLPSKYQARLIRLGLLGDDRHIEMSLEANIFDWEKTNHATSKEYQKQAPARIRKICQECGFTDFGSIRAVRFEEWIGKKHAEGIAAETLNTYIRNFRTFCKWMHAEGRTIRSPITHVRTLNAKVNPKRQRRALVVEEQKRLLRAAREGLLVNGMLGRDREMLYRVALLTGLRWSELRSLTRASFDLDAATPFIMVSAAHSKRKRKDILPLGRSLAVALRLYLANHDPADKAFLGMWQDKGASMIRADLLEAGIEYKNAEGVCDFHALRHTFSTTLAACGVLPKVSQELSRHSSITLTMDRYTHTGLNQLVDALDKLPDLT